MINKVEDFLTLPNEEMTRVAVVVAEDQDVMDILRHTSQDESLSFTLIGAKAAILSLMEENRLSPDTVDIIDEPDHVGAAARAVELIRAGAVDMIMKGNIHTATYFKAAFSKGSGVRSAGLVSQICVYNKPDRDGLLFITDGVLAIEPTLEEKVFIIENAVKLARTMGVEKPKVAVISAIEVINPKMPDTIEAAVLSKMSDRGQIRNCVIDGPFGLDNAISPEAAAHKGIQGPVAGNADILLVPNLVVGNILNKAITYFSRQPSASIIVGTDFPVVATSRTDSINTKLLSIAITRYSFR